MMNIQLDRGAGFISSLHGPAEGSRDTVEVKGNFAEGAGTPTPVSGTMQKMQRTVTHVERYRKNI